VFDILIVDDGESWRYICRDTLEVAGYNCDLAVDTSSAIKKLDAGQYGLICMNFQLGDIGKGRALLQRLFRHFPHIPILLTTGYLAGSINEVYERANRFQKRYPNIKKVLLKGGETESPEEFVGALLEAVGELLPLSNDTFQLSDRVVSWLHLSDLHLGKRPYEQDKVLRQLLEDLGEARWTPDFIVVTGDIAFSAQTVQYQQAIRFFDKLLKITQLPKERLFLVPGNHDVDWGKLNPYLNSGVAATLSASDKVIDFFSDDPNACQTRKEILKRLENYAKFVNTYLVDEHGEPIRQFSDNDYFYVTPVETKAGRIAILGLNSAWASALQFDFTQKRAQDKGHLLIGEPQVDSALLLAQNCEAEFMIALMHHPFDWLKNFDREWAAAQLKDRCHLILHGHLHEVTVAHQISPEGDVIILGSGTTYEERDHRNGYSYVSLDLKTKTGVVYLRRYSPQKGGGWVPDTIAYPKAKSDKVSFKMP
jgi:CheY-like chemotaxis protein/3',5'-cyclic AMP phosphodiesterase CpdA